MPREWNAKKIETKLASARNAVNKTEAEAEEAFREKRDVWNGREGGRELASVSANIGRARADEPCVTSRDRANANGGPSFAEARPRQKENELNSVSRR